MPPTGQPLFIVLEGLDGTGTTTQARRLAQALEGAVCLTAEPSEGPIGQILRSHVRKEVDLDPTTAALAFTADRADHLARVIRPALTRGESVVCDRYLLSTLAYQGAEGADVEWILMASRDFDVPDLTIFLDVPDDKRLQRLGDRGTKAERYEDPRLSARLRSAYEASIKRLRAAGHTIEVIDGAASKDNVLQNIVRRLDALT